MDVRGTDPAASNATAVTEPFEVRTALPDRPRPELPDPYRPFWQMASKWILFRDPPDHTRLRGLVTKAFTPRIVQALAPRIAAIAEQLLDEVEPTGSIDLVSALIASESEDGALDEEELIAMCVLLVAGHETTVNLIGNGVLALLRHPEQLELLRSRLDLYDQAVEELLRFDSSEQFTFRFAREEIELRGRTIARGHQVGLVIGSANRDPEHFPEPDRLDLTRTPLRHLAFGMGIHFCLGAPLARLEARLALETLLRRLPGLRLVEEPLRWREGIGFRGLEALELRW